MRRRVTTMPRPKNRILGNYGLEFTNGVREEKSHPSSVVKSTENDMGAPMEHVRVQVEEPNSLETNFGTSNFGPMREKCRFRVRVGPPRRSTQ